MLYIFFYDIRGYLKQVKINKIFFPFMETFTKGEKNNILPNFYVNLKRLYNEVTFLYGVTPYHPTPDQYKYGTGCKYAMKMVMVYRATINFINIILYPLHVENLC